MPDTKVLHLNTNDRTALKDIFEEHYDDVCKTVHRFIKDRSLVEDIAQTVFIKLWEKRETIEITSSFAAYLHRMAMNESLMMLRKMKRQNETELVDNLSQETSDSVEKSYLQGELQSHITDAIDQLPPKTKVVFMLSRFEDMTYKEIAEKMEISVKTVENQMGRALRILREKMKGYLSVFF